MKVAGKRFWVWAGVWLLAFFVKGDLVAARQEKPNGQVTDGTSNTKHNVPHLKTAITQKGREKISANYKTGQFKAPTHKTAPKPDAFTVKQKSMADGNSKDPAAVKTLARKRRK